MARRGPQVVLAPASWRSAFALLALFLPFTGERAAGGSTPPDPLAATSDQRAEAASALAFALATGERTAAPDELEAALGSVRQQLVAEPASELSDRLRIRLCATRRALGASGGVEERPLPPGEPDLQPPTELHTPVPTPPTVLRQRMRGDQRAVIESVVDSDGCVTPQRVVESTSPEWSGYAIDQVANWVFRPAHLRDRPVSVRFQLTVKYKRR